MERSEFRWISVEEKLPGPNEKVLVCLKKIAFSIEPRFKVEMADYIGNGVWQFRYGSGALVADRPEYWMPLPEPPHEHNFKHVDQERSAT